MVLSHSAVLAPVFQSVWLSVALAVQVCVLLLLCFVLTQITQDWMCVSLCLYMHLFGVCLLYVSACVSACIYRVDGHAVAFQFSEIFLI